MHSPETPNGSGLARLLRAARCSLAGLGHALRREAAFRQELALAVALGLAAWGLDVSPLERAALLGALLLVLIAELLNSAIEAVVDRIGPEYHELSGRAKDLGSAAVLLALVNAVLCWVLILWP